VDQGADRLTFRLVLLAGIRVLADEQLLLRVNADDRLAGARNEPAVELT